MAELNTFNDLQEIKDGHEEDVIPRITGVQFYQEQTGECKGFQLIYHDIADKTYTYIDETQNICQTTEFRLGLGQYIKDVEVDINYDSAIPKLKNKFKLQEDDIETLASLNVKFVLNDDTEYLCGVIDQESNFVGLIPQTVG